MNSLDQSERFRLHKFAASPYFSDNKWFLAVVQYCSRKNIDSNMDSKDADIKEADLYAAAYGDKPFTAQGYNRLLSDATVLLLRFLEVETLLYNKDTAILPNAALQAALPATLQKRQLYKLYETEAQERRADLAAQPRRDAHYYAQQLALDKLQLAYTNTEQRRTDRSNLEAVHTHLDIYFILQKLRYTCEVLNRENVLQHEYRITGVAYLLEWLRDSAYLREPAVAVYLQVYQLLTQADDASFDTLKTTLWQHEACFAAAELKELYIYSVNFCIRQVNKGEERYLHEYLDIVWRLLDSKVLLVNGELLVADYKNTVAIGLRAGEFDKIEHFVKTYSAYLAPEHRENAITYNLAKLYFEKTDYDKVIAQLREVVFENVYYALDSRWILLKTYYLLREELALEAAMQSFRVYLLRNKTISTYTKQQYLQLIILLKRILLLPQKDEKYADALRASIASKTIVADKRWLIAQTYL